MKYASNNKWCHCLQVKVRQQQEAMSLVLGEKCDNDKRCHCFRVRCQTTTNDDTVLRWCVMRRQGCTDFSGEVLYKNNDVLSFRWNVTQRQIVSLFWGAASCNNKDALSFQVKCHSTTRMFCLFRWGVIQRLGCFVFSGEVLCNETDSLPMTDEQRLYRRLRMNYDPFTRPVYNASQPVVVKIGITLTQIFDLVSVIVHTAFGNTSFISQGNFQHALTWYDTSCSHLRFGKHGSVCVHHFPFTPLNSVRYR